MRRSIWKGPRSGRIREWHQFNGMWNAHNQLGVTDKVGSQDYEFCKRISLASFKGQLWHMTGIRGMCNPLFEECLHFEMIPNRCSPHSGSSLWPNRGTT